MWSRLYYNEEKLQKNHSKNESMTRTAQQNTVENYLFPLIKKILVNYWRLNGGGKSDENIIGKGIYDRDSSAKYSNKVKEG